MSTTIDNVHTFACFECGATCATAGSDAIKNSFSMPVAAVTPDGKHICDVCVGNRQLATLASGDSELVYISTDGRTFTTWGGTKLGVVTSIGREGWIPVRPWSGVTNDGVLVYGKTQGRGMCATVHPRRRRGQVRLVAGSVLAMEGVSVGGGE